MCLIFLSWFTKQTTNGFFNVLSDLWQNYQEIIITGCCTDICVMQFALSLKGYLLSQKKDNEVIIYEEMVSTYDGPNHEASFFQTSALEILKLAGVKIQKWDQNK
ncbi:cysteine hydrolase family protein [Mycoplasmopsis gallopavonis]|uniref:cysteine hydrolase family protein n=1 Tax=Mycoplasmopsis gallopavonis TaxID=76629 RepID=UPI0016020F40|nr:isochorismatase family protein [Mycoplasmopsis gallopavonis]